MATTTRTSLVLGMLTRETLSDTFSAGLATTTVVHNAYEFKKTLNASSTPAASFISEQTITASASGTINLLSLPTTEGTRSATGLKLVAMRIENLGTNDFSIVVGSATGYVIGGAAIVVEPLGCVLHYFADGLADIDATHKFLDYTFDVDDDAQISMLLG